MILISESIRPGCRRKFGFEKGFALGIFGADGGGGAVEGIEWPGDVEGGVVPEDGALALGVVGIGGLIEDLGGVGEDEEAVGEAFGDPKGLNLALVGERLKVEAGPFTEVGGVAAEVDGHVPDMAGEDTDELSLGLTELIVKAAENTFGGKGLVILHEAGRKPALSEGILIEDLSEPPAIVAKTFRLYKFDIKQRGIQNEHPMSLSTHTAGGKYLRTRMIGEFGTREERNL